MKRAPFVGREKEISGLQRLLKKKVASLVTVQGRRRIGKSRLIEEFARRSGYNFYRFSGLPPKPGLVSKDQKTEFARSLKEQFGFKDISSSDWGDLFNFLALQVGKGKSIVLLDEISWMAEGDPAFLGKLKNAWDIHFKENPKLILVLCGSVSSWIENNILRNTGYVGRVSHSIFLEELSLQESSQLLKRLGAYFSSWETFLILSITGGVPRYLEEIDVSETAEGAIRQLCFRKEGLLFREFENMFSELFSKKSSYLKKIIEALRERNLSYSEICSVMGVEKSSHVLEWLEELVQSGFLSRDYTWNIRDAKESKLSRYRIKDNYIRFYLKYIHPNAGKIQKGHFEEYSLSSLSGWNTIMGFQFENLILSNRKWIIEKLGLKSEEILGDNPFFQSRTKRHKSCQIDYLIQTKFNTLYVCEIKYSRKEISSKILKEMKEKIDRLSTPKGYSCRPVLIHLSGVSESVETSGYFSNIIDLNEFLETNE